MQGILTSGPRWKPLNVARISFGKANSYTFDLLLVYAHELLEERVVPAELLYLGADLSLLERLASAVFNGQCLSRPKMVITMMT